jgi:hypothetical protein
VTIFQHSLPFLPSESFKTQSVVGLSVHLHTTTAPRRIVQHYARSSPDDRMSSPSTVQSHVLLSQFPDTNLIFQPRGVRSQIHVCTRVTSEPDCCIRRSSKTINPVTIETPVHCCDRSNAACPHLSANGA